MKNFKTILILALIYCGLFSYSQLWEKKYGFIDIKERSHDIIETYDNGFIILGWINGVDGWLIKTDVNGDTLWSKVLINNFGQLTPNRICLTPDNGLLIIGGGVSDLSNTNNPFLLKLNSCGKKEWCTFLYNENLSYAWDVIVNDNGDYLVLTAYMGDPINERIHLYCFDENGNVLWRNRYASKYDHPLLEVPECHNLFQTSDGGFIIIGRGYHPKVDDPNGLKPLRALYIKVDSEGNEEWVLPFGIDSYMPSKGHVLIENVNGFFTGFGTHYTDSLNPIIMNFDYSGNQIDYHILEADTLFNNCYDYFFKSFAEQMDNGNYNVGVYHNYELYGDANWGQIIMDENYNIIKSFNQLNSFSDCSMVKTSDNKYVQASKTPEIDDPYDSDIYMFKLNENLEYDSVYTQAFEYDYACDYEIESDTIYFDDCNIIVGTEEIPTPKEYLEQKVNIKITPNPAKEEISLGFENIEKYEKADLSIISVLGQEVYKATLIKGQTKLEIPIKNWEYGTYIVHIYSNGKMLGSSRFVKM